MTRRHSEKRKNMEKRKISFSPPDISELEIAEVAEALRSGWITTGPRTKLLERRLAAYEESGRTDVDCTTDEAVEEIYRQLDIDGNGTIEFEEFKKYVKQILIQILEEM